MSKGDLLEMEGVIQDALGGGQYTIKVDQGAEIARPVSDLSIALR